MSATELNQRKELAAKRRSVECSGFERLGAFISGLTTAPNLHLYCAAADICRIRSLLKLLLPEHRFLCYLKLVLTERF